MDELGQRRLDFHEDRELAFGNTALTDDRSKITLESVLK